MSSLDPFSSRFEVFGREARHVVPGINARAFERLIERLNPGPGADGRVVLLKAPRAGYGKTLLLQRAAGELVADHHFVKVGLVGGRTIDAAHVLECLLESLCRVLPASEGLTMLDLAARKIIARGLEPLVRSGEVPCQDRDGALRALQEAPVETFDFHHEAAVTAHWTEANFEILGPRLAAEMARVSGASLRESAYWVELLFRFATTSPENVERSRLLFETVFQPEGLRPADSGAGERLHGLLSLVTIATRLVLVIDDTEGLSTHPPDALELSSFITNLAQTCPGTLVLLSVNSDVWDTAFAPRLPGGLADRLTEHEVRLQPLSREEAELLVRDRGGPDASEVLDRMNWSDGNLYARGVLKEAAQAWDAWQEERQGEAAPTSTPDDTFGTLDDLATLEKKDGGEDPVEPVAEEEAPAEELAEKPEAPPSLSAAAAALLAAGGKKAEEMATVAEKEETGPVDEAEEAPPLEEPAFEASSYATPQTPLTEDEPPTGEEAGKSSVLSDLANPTEPLVEEDSPTEEEAEAEEPAAASGPFAPVTPEAPSVFAPVEPVDEPEEEAEVSAPTAEEEKPDPFSAPSPFDDEPAEADATEDTESPASAAPSPFAKIWNDEAAIELPDEKESDDGDEPTAGTSPFEEPVSKPAPSPFDALDTAKQEEESPAIEAEEDKDTPEAGENGVPSPFEPFSPAPSGSDNEPAAKPSTPSPFEPAAPPEEPKAPAGSSPFQPVAPGPAPVSSSPFAPADPPPATEPASPPEGLGALTGSGDTAAPADPFADEKKEESAPEAESKPSPFSPVGEGGLPPKRGGDSPFAPVRDVTSSPFDPPKAEEPATEEADPTGASADTPEKSPFEPVDPEPKATPASTPFTPVDRGSSADSGSREDEDKVDELLRQFKERYGRD